MRKLIVVNNPKQWSLDLEHVEVLSAQQYLTDPAFARLRGVRVFNLCREYRYQSKGYYVSLLAEARGHKVIPSVKTIQDLKEPPIVRIVSEELDVLIQRSLRQIKGDTFVLSIYFGENLAKQHLRLSQELYRLFQAPFLRAQFVRKKQWTLQHVRALAMSDIPEAHRPFVQNTAARYFAKKRYDGARPSGLVYDLAILVDPNEPAPPSDPNALQRFEKAAEAQGFSVERITREDYSRIGEFDALLIRATTSVDHYTYRFARRAQSEGLPIIDHPEAILRCANKVYLAEVLAAARIPTPQTLIVHADNRRTVEAELGLPCVLKLPDSSFSMGVVKVHTPDALQTQLDAMLAKSDLVIAQRYAPTDFDWRIGILDGRLLFACKYYMAKGHWQIYDWTKATTEEIEGAFETLPVDAVPEAVAQTALQAVRLLGDGLFGVDLKEIDGRPYVIEINDNPSIDHEVEDLILGDALYAQIITALRRRLLAKMGGPESTPSPSA